MTVENVAKFRLGCRVTSSCCAVVCCAVVCGCTVTREV